MRKTGRFEFALWWLICKLERKLERMSETAWVRGNYDARVSGARKFGFVEGQLHNFNDWLNELYELVDELAWSRHEKRVRS